MCGKYKAGFDERKKNEEEKTDCIMAQILSMLVISLYILKT